MMIHIIFPITYSYSPVIHGANQMEQMENTHRNTRTFTLRYGLAITYFLLDHAISYSYQLKSYGQNHYRVSMAALNQEPLG